jgi:hypothetical protein
MARRLCGIMVRTRGKAPGRHGAPASTPDAGWRHGREKGERPWRRAVRWGRGEGRSLKGHGGSMVGVWGGVGNRSGGMGAVGAVRTTHSAVVCAVTDGGWRAGSTDQRRPWLTDGPGLERKWNLKVQKLSELDLAQRLPYQAQIF